METRPRVRRWVAVALLLGLVGCGDRPQTGDRAAPLPPDYQKKQAEIAKGFYEATKGKAGGMPEAAAEPE